MALHHKIEKNKNGIILKLSGAIDEQSQFENIEVPTAKHITIDLDEVTSLNSIGLRNWSRWSSELPTRAKSISYRNCPSVVVHQMSILDTFLLKDSIVESAYVPFFCETCNHSENILAIRNKDYLEATADAPEKIMIELEKKCTKCGGKSEADVVLSKHFKFLKKK